MADAERSRTYQDIVAEPYSTQYNGDIHGDVHNTTSNVYNNHKSFHERILDSLRFPGMNTYQMRPLESFPGTFEWIFDETKAMHSCAQCDELSMIVGKIFDYCHIAEDDSIDWEKYDSLVKCLRATQNSRMVLDQAAKFRSWLQTSDEIFWISGKAGAGKSCLMKFLLEHEHTHELLLEWAGQPVHLAGFFFWAAGGDLEKSHDGLLRGLLYQTLQEQPDLSVCLESSNEHAINTSQPWTSKRLRHAFDMITMPSTSAMNFVFFIDGLDEFHGDLSDLIETLDVLNRSANIKICVSSRPWNVFQNSYGLRDNSLHFRLHDLTVLDMNIYISGRLENTPMFKKALSSNVDAFQVIDAVRYRAEGVFLWVSLAVNRLRRLMEDSSSVVEMLKAIEKMPSELQALLQQIFDSIEGFHVKSAARTFLVLLEGWGGGLVPAPFLLYFDDDAHVDWTVEGAHLTRNGSRAARRWCKDLVHLEHDSGVMLCDIIRNATKSPVDIVQFPHRSVRDFIADRAADGSLWRLAEEPFCPAFALCYATAQLAQSTISSPVRIRDDIATLFVRFGNKVRRSMESDLVDLVRTFDAHGEILARQEGISHWSLLDKPQKAEEVGELDGLTRFMGFALCRCCPRLFRLMLREFPGLNTEQARMHWLMELLCTDDEELWEYVEILQAIFEPDDQLNEFLSLPAGNYVWRVFLETLHSTTYYRDPDYAVGIAELLLRHGANPDIMLPTCSLHKWLSSDTSDSDSDSSLQLSGHTSELLSPIEQDTALTGFLGSNYLPATAAFEVPNASTPYRSKTQREFVGEAFPQIKALLVAASKAKAAAQAATQAAREAQYLRENPPTWESIAVYL